MSRGNYREPCEHSGDAAQTDSNDADDIDSQQLEQAAETLRALAHPHRLRMLARLAHGARSVSWLAEDCGIRSHTASEHLRLMQKLDFVKSQRQGRFTYYRLHGLAGRQLIDMVETWMDAEPTVDDHT